VSTGRERVDDFEYEVVHGNVRYSADMAMAIASDLDALAAARDAAGPVRAFAEAMASDVGDDDWECHMGGRAALTSEQVHSLLRALDRQCQHGESLGCYCRRCDPDGGNE
jgi:hypothetical protein